MLDEHPKRSLLHRGIDLARHVHILLDSERCGIKPVTVQLEAEVEDLTQALGEAAVEIRVWKKSAEGRLGPSRTSR
jgi:hypothetical protein